MFYLKLFLSSLVTYKRIIKKFPPSLCSEQKGLVTHLLAAILWFGGGRGWYKNYLLLPTLTISPLPPSYTNPHTYMVAQTTGDNERNCLVQQIFIG